MSDYDSDEDIRRMFEVAYEAIRERVANGGPGWTPKVSVTVESKHVAAASCDRSSSSVALPDSESGATEAS